MYLKLEDLDVVHPALMAVVWEFSCTFKHLTLLVLQTRNSDAGTVCKPTRSSNCSFS